MKTVGISFENDVSSKWKKQQREDKETAYMRVSKLDKRKWKIINGYSIKSFSFSNLNFRRSFSAIALLEVYTNLLFLKRPSH